MEILQYELLVLEMSCGNYFCAVKSHQLNCCSMYLIFTFIYVCKHIQVVNHNEIVSNGLAFMKMNNALFDDIPQLIMIILLVQDAASSNVTLNWDLLTFSITLSIISIYYDCLHFYYISYALNKPIEEDLNALTMSCSASIFAFLFITFPISITIVVIHFQSKSLIVEWLLWLCVSDLNVCGLFICCIIILACWHKFHHVEPDESDADVVCV